MIKKLSFLLICVHILCAENFAESSPNYNNLDSAVNSQDSAPFAESSQNSNLDSADSANPPPQSKHYKTQNLKAYLSDISPKIPHFGRSKTPFASSLVRACEAVALKPTTKPNLSTRNQTAFSACTGD